jgi:hypothetical protein
MADPNTEKIIAALFDSRDIAAVKANTEALCEIFQEIARQV